MSFSSINPQRCRQERSGKKLKLLADACIPKPFTDELRANGLFVRHLNESRFARHSDEVIIQEAKRRGYVLLTMDRDFWDDRKHPLKKCPGVIFVNVDPSKIDDALEAMALFYVLFARAYPLDWWPETKAKLKRNSFVIKGRTWKGDVFEDEFKLTDDGRVLTRSIR